MLIKCPIVAAVISPCSHKEAHHVPTSYQRHPPRGRPKGPGGGRAQALATLDRMLSQHGPRQALMVALEKEFQADPARFFRNTVIPLLLCTASTPLPPPHQ